MPSRVVSLRVKYLVLTTVPTVLTAVLFITAGGLGWSWYVPGGLALMILIGVVWLLLRLSRASLSRLGELSQMATVIGSGAFAARIPVQAFDELGQLAATFNTMAESLSASYRTLDERVEARTRELTRINAQIEESNRALQVEIGERKRAEQALQESQVHMRAIFQAALDAMITVDTTGRIVEFNPAAERILGYAPEAVVGKELSETLFSSPESEIQRRRIGRYLPSGEGSFLGKRFEVTARCSDGRQLPVEMAMAVTHLQAGPLLTVYLRDISERRRAEEQIKSLARLPDESPNPIVRVSRQGVVLYANKAAAPALAQLGCQVGQALSGRWRQSVAETLAQNRAREMELPCASVTILFLLTPVLDSGYVNFYGRDVTASKLAQTALEDSEALYHSLVDTLPLCIFRKDRQGHMTFANRLFLQTVDKSLSDLVGRTDADLYPPELAAKYRRDDERVMASEELFHDVEENQHADGHRVYVEVLKTPVYDAKRNVVGTQCMFWDVSARKRAEAAVEQTTAELSRSNADLQQFAYAASHYLQEPLRKIQTFSGRLQAKFADALNDEGRDHLDRMVNAAQRMQELIESLLTLSRVMTKAEPFRPVDLNGVVRGVLSDLEVSIRETGATVDVEPLPTIDADATQLRQLFQNLIGNALKFRRPDVPPVVRIYAADDKSAGDAPPRSGNVVRLVIEDNGIGFDEKYLDRIFVAFQRLHTRTEYPGTGMGLAICRKIVERHNGAITAESRPDQGARFIVTLPRRQVVSPKSPAS